LSGRCRVQLLNDHDLAPVSVVAVHIRVDTQLDSVIGLTECGPLLVDAKRRGVRLLDGLGDLCVLDQPAGCEMSAAAPLAQQSFRQSVPIGEQQSTLAIQQQHQRIDAAQCRRPEHVRQVERGR
jgi:hypothetical protein